MILGRLFKRIFEEKIKVIFTSNIFINDLYKDGLQRDQFIPFIKILENNSYEKELSIKEDYRSSNNISLERFLYPIDKSSNFKFNKFINFNEFNKFNSSDTDWNKPWTSVAYLVGAIGSSIAGIVGMNIAVRGNSRTAEAAEEAKALANAYEISECLGNLANFPYFPYVVPRVIYLAKCAALNAV